MENGAKNGQLPSASASPSASQSQDSKNPGVSAAVVIANKNAIFQHLVTMDRSSEPDVERCANRHRDCPQPRVEGYDLCIRHILFDKSAPYRQCAFVHPQTHRQCPLGVKKLERQESFRVLCDEHINYKPFNKTIENFKQQFMPSSDLLPQCSSSSILSPTHLPSTSSPTSSGSHSPATSPQKALQNYQRLKRKFEELDHLCSDESDGHLHHRHKPDWEINCQDRTIIMNRSFQEKKMEAYCRVLYGESKEQLDIRKMKVSDITVADDFEEDSTTYLAKDPLRYAGHYSLGDIENSLNQKFVRMKDLHIQIAKTRPQIMNLQSELRRLKNRDKNGILVHPPTHSSTPILNTTFQFGSQNSYSDSQHNHHNHNHSHKGKIPDSESSSSTSLSQTPTRVPIVVLGGEKEAETNGLLETIGEKQQRTSHHVKKHFCIYAKDKEKCSNEVVPETKYCSKHALYNPPQVLFRPCGAPLVANDPSAGSCFEPIVPYTTQRTCLKHVAPKYTL